MESCYQYRNSERRPCSTTDSSGVCGRVERLKTAKRTFFVALTVAALLSMLSGCTFSKMVVNPGHQNLDTSFIKVGETTAYDVLNELGPPAPVTDQSENVRFVSARHLRYITYEEKTTRFLFAIGLVTPFEWTDGQVVEELLIELDEGGHVSNVYRTLRDTIRPPLEKEKDREPLVFEDLTARLQP